VLDLRLNIAIGERTDISGNWLNGITYFSNSMEMIIIEKDQKR
jgi:hypothetical protein